MARMVLVMAIQAGVLESMPGYTVYEVWYNPRFADVASGDGAVTAVVTRTFH